MPCPLRMLDLLPDQNRQQAAVRERSLRPTRQPRATRSRDCTAAGAPSIHNLPHVGRASARRRAQGPRSVQQRLSLAWG